MQFKDRMVVESVGGARLGIGGCYFVLHCIVFCSISLPAFAWALNETHMGAVRVSYEDMGPIWVACEHSVRVGCIGFLHFIELHCICMYYISTLTS